jgi:putative endonuclease
VVDRQALGRWGEDLAVRHLEAEGLEMVARNWRCREGELDLVARDSGVLVFVEVKTRTSARFGVPAEAVTPHKAARIRRLSQRWLAEVRPPYAAELRFDVVSVLRTAGLPEVLHLRGAF